VFLSWIGCAILAVSGALGAWRMWRSRREAVRA
jgi:hypothetical protein